jgi:hypothetical protein
VKKLKSRASFYWGGEVLEYERLQGFSLKWGDGNKYWGKDRKLAGDGPLSVGFFEYTHSTDDSDIPRERKRSGINLLVQIRRYQVFSISNVN